MGTKYDHPYVFFLWLVLKNYNQIDNFLFKKHIVNFFLSIWGFVSCFTTYINKW